MFKRFAISAVAIAALAACSSQPGTPGSGSGISGAGATFPAPLYAKWASAYHEANGDQVNYQGIGSGGGIKQIKSNTVDFGASDKPLKPDELDAAGLLQFPTVMGGVVPVVNLSGIKAGQVHLTGQVLGDIFLGKIKAWNAPEIAALNQGVNLPSTPITVVHRSDGSGTTFLFTTYLSDTNADWKAKPGASDSLAWPTGLGGKGNEGAIGYVEYAYAKQNSLPYALVRNKDGQYPDPTAPHFAAAAASADWAHAAGNYMLLLDQPGKDTWPITAVTYILVHKQATDAARAASVLKFFDWAYTSGDDQANKLDYVPLPASVKTMIRGQWSQVQAGGKAVYTPK